jgi:DNA polymerase III subunit beta
MKLLCSTSEFLQSLQLVSRAIGGQQALPILGNILLEAKGDRCTASATDLEISIVTSFPAKIEREGSITVPAKAILNFAQYNADAEVLLEVKEGTQLKCSSQHAKTSIAGAVASEYPTISKVEKQTHFTLKADPLLHALHLVTFAAAKTTLRPVLSGVYLRSAAQQLILVATDSYRLSECKIPAEGDGIEVSCIIPAKILEELKTILGSFKSDKKAKGEGEQGRNVGVALSRQQIELQVGETRLVSRLIDGKFPNYEQIIPKEAKTKLYFPLHNLSTAVKRLHYFAKEMNNTLTFHCAKETRVITPQTPMGQDEATIQGELTGEENKIALSSSYLLDFLGHISAEGVIASISDAQHPAIFTLPDQKDFLHLIMPLRLQAE